MTQAERDRLVALKKAKKKLITQREAAEELGLSVRPVKRLIYALKKHGDKAVVHKLRGRPSNRKIEERIELEAKQILSAPVYKGFGPTLAAEYLESKHGITASKETVRQWMLQAQLWRGKKQKVKQVHTWRPRRSRFGELVQWDSSDHDWLEGRGERRALEQLALLTFLGNEAVIGIGLADSLDDDFLALGIGLGDQFDFALLDSLDVAHLLHRMLPGKPRRNDGCFEHLT